MERVKPSFDVHDEYLLSVYLEHPHPVLRDIAHMGDLDVSWLHFPPTICSHLHYAPGLIISMSILNRLGFPPVCK